MVQHMIRSTKIDHKQFNLFLDSKFGKNLLKGLLDVITSDGVSTVAKFCRENKSYEYAMSL